MCILTLCKGTHCLYYYMKIVFALLVTLFILATTLFAQHETDKRVIGFKYILKFNQNNPEVSLTNKNLYDPFNPNYKGDLQTPHANSICDTLGNMLFYYDGTSIYQANGEVMQNGILHKDNFSSYYNNALIVPIEEGNRRYYYLFETIPYQEDWNYITDRPIEDVLSCYYPNACGKFWDLCKLQYHIIDMQANGGNGGVFKKNIFIADSVAPSISGIKHQNNIGTWVSVLKYRTNTILNYLVNSCSIQNPIINTIPDFEYQDKPYYVSYSPSAQAGFQIVYSTKGDYAAFPGNKISDRNSSTSTTTPFYLFIAPFDNQTGLFDFHVLKTITVQSGADANLFSHDSKYLYYHNSNLIAPTWIYQYELSSGTSLAFYYNKGTSDNLYSGVDYGKSNDIIIYKVTLKPKNNSFKYVSYLGAIKHIDQPFVSSNLIDSLMLPGIDQPDDKVLYTYIARNNYIYNFYHPDYKKPNAFPVAKSLSNAVASPSCFNIPVTLKGNTNIPVDSLYWVIKKSGQSNWQRFNADTFDLPVSPDTYTASLVSYKYCLADSTTQQFTIEDYPSVNLANDTIYSCESKPVILPSNSTYKYYWLNEYRAVVPNQVSETGQYNMVVKNSCGTKEDSLYLKNSMLSVTNLVTANNDNRNDCLNAISTNPNEMIRMSIYNSWGSCIFSDNNYQNNWCPNNDLSDGVYYYEATYNNDCSKKGWVEIVH